ncbi:hypothetical protein ABL78_0360 [Leptomonas seymouri]|uniref:UBX domain-containing protein 11 n=1 Tax=Leptomonas seymouri TaxID=5684 RepID=A0A0N1IMT0_LEPSE|nr:hypothetical protein ABL78_0360 [Leptomonas seymouri]|eukprot:KPI90600.1 hypothetical protein ABL78_0360 [Leptomonas seymouri]
MENGHRRAPMPPGSPQKYRPAGPPKKKKSGALNDPLLLSPDVLDDATRRELLQEVLRPRRASPSLLERPPVGGRVGDGNNGGDDNSDREHFANQLRARVRSGNQNSDDLLKAMAARLKELEPKQKVYQLELQELHSKYRQLNDKYQRERQLREEAETAVLTLYEEKESLEKQLEALESITVSPRKGADLGSPSRNGGAPSTPKARQSAEKFDLFSGDFNADDGMEVIPTHFTNTALPGTLLFSPQKTMVDAHGNVAASATKTPPQAQANKDRRRSSPSVDVALLQKNARILSDYVGWKGVVKRGNQAGIRERDVVQVVLYKNGICVNRGPFRPYGWALCDAFLDDLTEGYYPYEFKEKYPDGFPIEITDRSSEACEVDANGFSRATAEAKSTAAGEGRTTASSSPVFPAEGGRRLGGVPVEAGKSRSIHTLQDCKDSVGYTPISAAEFLSKIPAQRVTASGQLVPVRDEVAALMGMKERATTPSGNPTSNNGPSNTVKRVAAAEAAYRRAKALQQQEEQPSASTSSNISGDKAGAQLAGCSPVVADSLIAIIVRLPNGHAVTLCVSPEDTVAALRQKFVAAAPQFAQRPYELCQAFPVKCEWNEHFRTLKSLGVQKSCTLMLKLK